MKKFFFDHDKMYNRVTLWLSGVYMTLGAIAFVLLPSIGIAMFVFGVYLYIRTLITDLACIAGGPSTLEVTIPFGIKIVEWWDCNILYPIQARWRRSRARKYWENWGLKTHQRPENPYWDGM